MIFIGEGLIVLLFAFYFDVDGLDSVLNVFDYGTAV